MNLPCINELNNGSKEEICNYLLIEWESITWSWCNRNQHGEFFNRECQVRLNYLWRMTVSLVIEHWGKLQRRTYYAYHFIHYLSRYLRLENLQQRTKILFQCFNVETSFSCQNTCIWLFFWSPSLSLSLSPSRFYLPLIFINMFWLTHFFGTLTWWWVNDVMSSKSLLLFFFYSWRGMTE